KHKFFETSNDSVKCSVLKDIANAYIFENPDSSFYYADKTITCSEKKKYYENIGDSYRLKGIVSIMKSDTKNAEKYFKLSYKYFKMLNKDYDKYRSAYYINMNILYIQELNYPKALLYADSAMMILENKNDSLSMSNLAKLYTNKSNILNDRGMFREAIECNLKAIELTDKTKEKNRKEINYLNIGNSFGYLGEYDKAAEYFALAKNTAKENQNNYILVKALNNLASMYGKKKDYEKSIDINLELINFLDSLHIENKKVLAFVTLSESYGMTGNTKKAEEFLKKSLKTAEEYNDESMKLLAYTTYGTFLIKQGKFKQGIIYADKALKIAEAQNNLNSLIDIFESKYKAYEKIGQLDSSVCYLKKYQVLKDSFENEKVKKDIYNLEIKYQTAEKEKENQKLQYKNTLQEIKIAEGKKIRNFYLFALIFALIFILIIFIQLRKKNNAYEFLVKKNNELSEKEQELKAVKEKLIRSAVDKREPVYNDEKKEELLTKIENEFDGNKIYKEDITLKKLAEKLDSNTSYLSGIFNTVYKKSFSDFVNEYRIKEATELFNNPDFDKLSTDAVGIEAGFNTGKTFVRAFKKHIGVTPSYYRKHNK
ncbi:MAG: helix-turn-helix domain-containing protein, partial [Bacteroidales bacterium]|nr:helix-turn-helix domain-containing protein [Bacteroidales bacterium]